MVELSFEGYQNCTYLYQNLSEPKVDHYQEWSYVLAGISDFICILTPQLPIITTTSTPNVTSTPNITTPGFSLQLFITSQWSALSLLVNYSNNIEDLIEASYEASCNFTVERDTDFTVQILSISSAILGVNASTPQQNETAMHTVLVTALVQAFNTKVENLLIEVSKTEPFSAFLNFSFSLFFQNNAMTVQVYGINGQILNSTSTTTQAPQTTPTEVTSTTSTSTTTMSATSNASKESKDDVLPWIIAVIVLSIILICLILGGLCALCMRRRNHDKDATTAGAQKNKKK